MLTGYKGVERLDFEVAEGDDLKEVTEKLLELIPGEKAEKAFTMTIFVLEKEHEEKPEE